TANGRASSDPSETRTLIGNSQKWGAGTATIFVLGEDANFADVVAPKTRAPHPVTGVEVDMKVHLTSTILFADGSPVIETLEEIVFMVRQVLEAFKLAFQS